MHPLLAPLFAVLLGLAVLTLATDYFEAIHLVLAYLLFVVIALTVRDHDENDGISPLHSLQTALVFAIGVSLITLVVGGLGLRSLELLAVLALVFTFVLAHAGLRRSIPTTAPYLAAFVILFGLFLYHGRVHGAGSGLGLFPVLAGIVLAFNCFVIPRYVSADDAYWSIAAVSGAVSLLGLAAIVVGEFSVWHLEVRTWDGTAWFGGVPIIRSVFANPNTLGLLAFPGVVASAVLCHRSFRNEVPSVRTGLAAAALGTSVLGLLLSNSRASLLAAAVALGIYGSTALKGRRVLPAAVALTAIAIPGFLLAISIGVVPIDPTNRFTLWQAGFEAVRYDSGLFGQGIVGTSEALEPYSARGESVHSSYLSIAIRTGIVGGVAYCLLVVGPLVHGAWRFKRVETGMFALAAGFAVHQLFEGYTLFQFGHGSVLGALAVGYVITSLIESGRAVSTPADINRSESDDVEFVTGLPAVPSSPMESLRHDD
ncbi:O-antigen ligase family protein [Halalkalicoccus subterraneus]|uniref:O-antigen ligase family protein n=1 Tax=Halalkalicoccus subterraneus TaxID=2675002 RepID=UPI001FE48CB4|nr:O-antigen ligase family protein [Halalkalicoccus subterraneus]